MANCRSDLAISGSVSFSFLFKSCSQDAALVMRLDWILLALLAGCSRCSVGFSCALDSSLPLSICSPSEEHPGQMNAGNWEAVVLRALE